MADYANLPCRDRDENLLVVVETPRNSLVKVKYDPDLKVFLFGRPLTLGVAYPYDFGFVPSTKADDGDPLDAMVIFDCPTWPGIVVPAIEIGIVKMTQREHGNDERVRNDRVIVVPFDDHRVKHVDELSKRTREELEEFFAISAKMTGKKVHIEGWHGPKAAREAVEAATKKYVKGGTR
ncbi:MAG TPA: inorganic diphosphatase [Polyangiaceae bacterium]|jgi:inorganic pyrophosphatase|nr:inorganic diphosphatase [Polyangiaceae bacterium]